MSTEDAFDLHVTLTCDVYIFRFVILKHVRYDHIDPLPLPPKMKAYLRESQYYAEYIIDNDNMRGGQH